MTTEELQPEAFPSHIPRAQNVLDQYLRNNSGNKCPLHGLMENKATQNVTDIEKGFKTIWVVKENQAGSLQREIGHPGEAPTTWKALHRSCRRHQCCRERPEGTQATWAPWQRSCREGISQHQTPGFSPNPPQQNEANSQGTLNLNICKWPQER